MNWKVWTWPRKKIVTTLIAAGLIVVGVIGAGGLYGLRKPSERRHPPVAGEEQFAQAPKARLEKPSTTFFGPGGSSVKEILLPHGDPNVAGIRQRFHWTVSTGLFGWIPQRDLSGARAGTPNVVGLRGGKAYNVRAITKPLRELEFAFFALGAAREPKTFSPENLEELAAEGGMDLHPASDAILLVRWKEPEAAPRPFTFRVDLRAETPAERQRTRDVVRIDP